MIVSVQTRACRTSTDAERVVVDELGYEDDGILHLTAHFGFQDDQNVPRGAAAGGRAGPRGRTSTSTTPRTSSRRSRSCAATQPGMAPWRKKLFLALSRTSASPVEFFGLPDDQTVTMGSYIEL